jgi:hypothetical protein
VTRFADLAPHGAHIGVDAWRKEEQGATDAVNETETYKYNHHRMIEI